MDILYIISQMVNLLNIPICIYDSSQGILLRTGQEKGNRELSHKEKSLFHEHFQLTDEVGPVMHRLADNIFYVTIRVTDTYNKWVLAGPILPGPCTHNILKDAQKKYMFLQEMGLEIQQCNMRTFLSGVLMINYLIDGNKLNLSQFLEMNQDKFESVKQMDSVLSKTIFERQEKQSAHNPYSQELREIESIEQGDIEAFNRSIAETYEGEIGILAKDPLRHHKNVAIGNITLASRAAVRGGVSAEFAFSMADSFIQQIEEIDDIAEVETYKRAAQRTYAKAVRDQKNEEKSNHNPLVEEVKNYIFNHLHDNIRIEDIANSLHVNADYLSHLFSKSEKVTIKRYILQEKITRSKNLLCYSDFSLQEIAFYLGFTTQSYFTKIFREMVGMTPGEYRKKLKK